MIKLVIFDMDGLLIDSEPLWEKTTYKVYKKLGIELNDKHFSKMKGRPTKENAEFLFNKYGWDGPTTDEVVDLIVKEMVELVKTDISLKPGVHNAFQVCKKANLPISIASSSKKVIIDAAVHTLEIKEHFEHIYSAEFEPYGKPHPGVFISVAEHFNVPVENCLVFEDSPSGVLAAKSAKMKCIAVPDLVGKENPFIQTADIIINSLEEFDDLMLASL